MMFNYVIFYISIIILNFVTLSSTLRFLPKVVTNVASGAGSRLKKLVVRSKPTDAGADIDDVLVGDLDLGKTDVWKIAPFNHGDETPSSKVTIATTAKGYDLSCVPTPEARGWCSELAKLVGLESLHYVELLSGAGKLLESFCTSNLETMPLHVQHVCYLPCCSGQTCKRLHVIDVRMAKEGEDEEICRTEAIEECNAGPIVLKTSRCDSKTRAPDADSLRQECKNNRGFFPSPSEKRWKIKENLESLCNVVVKENQEDPPSNE